MAVKLEDLMENPALAGKYARENKEHYEVLRTFIAGHQYRLAKTYRRWKADPSQICTLIDAATHPKMIPPEDEGRPVSIQLGPVAQYEGTPIYVPMRRVADSLRARNATTMLTMVVFSGMTLLTLIQKDGTRESAPFDDEFQNWRRARVIRHER